MHTDTHLLVTVERGFCHFVKSQAAMRLRKACMDWWAIPSTVTIKGQKVYYLLRVSRIIIHYYKYIYYCW